MIVFTIRVIFEIRMIYKLSLKDVSYLFLLLQAMASVEVILENINPVKSSKAYDAQWRDFLCHSKIQENEDPKEEHFIKYFHHLREEKKYASSSLWCKYSMINHKYQVLYGHKLQKFPRLTLLLKKFEAGYQRKTASVFTKEEIMRFLETAPNNGEFIHMKAGIVIAYFGGLRCADLINLDVDDLEFDESTGMWVSYAISKQKGESVRNRFNIPIQFCSYLEAYDHAINRCGAGEGRLMKSYRVRKDNTGYYTKQPMGENLLRKFTVKMAQFLNLPQPEKYTGHAIRRSCASIMAEAGASSSQLKKHFNWKSESTSLKYIESTDSGKRTIADMLTPDQPEKKQVKTEKIEQNVVNLTNCTNVVINFQRV